MIFDINGALRFLLVSNAVLTDLERARPNVPQRVVCVEAASACQPWRSRESCESGRGGFARSHELADLQLTAVYAASQDEKRERHDSNLNADRPLRNVAVERNSRVL